MLLVVQYLLRVGQEERVVHTVHTRPPYLRLLTLLPHTHTFLLFQTAIRLLNLYLTLQATKEPFHPQISPRTKLIPRPLPHHSHQFIVVLVHPLIETISVPPAICCSPTTVREEKAWSRELPHPPAHEVPHYHSCQGRTTSEPEHSCHEPAVDTHTPLGQRGGGETSMCVCERVTFRIRIRGRRWVDDMRRILH